MKKKIKKPITHGVCKVPVVMQLEMLECGAASLAMVLAYYGKWVALEQLRVDCGVSRDGSNAYNILKAAEHYGLETEGYTAETEDLRNDCIFPCIIHWNLNHFVVLRGFRGNKAYLNDPEKGAYSVPIEKFDECFTGVYLTFKPKPTFAASGKKRSVLEFTKKRLKGAGLAITFCILTAVIGAILNVISPAFQRIFIDELLTKNAPTWVGSFLICFSIFIVLQLIIALVQTIYSLKINGKFASIGSTSYMWKILKMPIAFFSQRMAGDIKIRKDSNASIANTLISVYAPLLLEFVMMIVYLVVMIRHSWILTIIGLVAIAIDVVVSNYISHKRINIARVAMRDAAKLESATLAGVEMIETIKSSGSENGYFAKWSGYQANVNSQNIRSLKLNQYLGMIPEFTSTMADILVLVVGVYLTMSGSFTVGMIMAFQGFLSSFMSPAQQLISVGQQIQEMRTEMERLDDVMEYPDDDAFAIDTLEEGKKYRKLSGDIEIKNVSFGYSPLAEPLIKNFNLSLKKGQSVAIVGSSGSGKSTMAKLISGLYQPWSGSILFDNKKTKQIEKSIFSSSVAVVDQDIVLFEDTIANNIKMFDETIEDYEVILAAKDAQLHDEILTRNEGYQYKIREGGKDFSGGQRQRMEIARVLAQDPTIIILDEATSALDAKTEFEVVKAIKDRGITTIVVAHRLSTIRTCDEIIVLNNGNIIARGTHDELMKSSSYYQDLISNE